MEHVKGVWLFTILINVVAAVDRSTISFSLGLIVSILAIIHYVIQIKIGRKKLKD